MALIDELLAPVPGDNPAGAYLRYDPIYDRIKEARREDLDAPQGEWQTSLKTADWPLVVKLATEALGTRTKDLQLAVWLTEGLLQRNGFPGLQQGLEVTLGLIEGFWDHLHPELEDGDAEMRAAPLNWLGQYLVTAVRRAPLTRDGHGVLAYVESRNVGYEGEGDSDAREAALAEGKLSAEEFDKSFAATPKAWLKEQHAAIDAALALVVRLERVCDERFGPDSPSLSKLREAIIEAQRTAGQLLERKLKADPDPIEVELAPSISIPHGSAGGVMDLGGGGGASSTGGAVAAAPSAPPGSREEAAGRVTAAARFLRAQSPADPSSYLMLRGLRWGELRGANGEVDPRRLEAAPTEIRSRLKGLLLAEKWSELLEAAEEVMGTPYGRGWLDLQRYSVTACDSLSSDYAVLSTSLRSALQWLLRDLPELPDLTLMDDSPTANRETRQWLHAEGLIGGDEPAAPAVVTRVPSRRDVLQQARERVRIGDAAGAIQMLMRESDQAPSARDRFLRRLEAAQLMVEGGYEAVAMPILKEIEQLIETHGLEAWESGPTIAQPLGLLYRCIRKLEDGGDAQEIFLRVSRLDPVHAMRLVGGGSNGESGG